MMTKPDYRLLFQLSAKATLVAMMVSAALVSVTCSPSYLSSLGAIAGRGGTSWTDAAMKAARKEACLVTLKSALDAAKIKGSRHFVDAVRAWLNNEPGTASAAWQLGLSESGAQPKQVADVMYGAAVTIRLTSPEVSQELCGFISYMNANR